MPLRNSPRVDKAHGMEIVLRISNIFPRGPIATYLSPAVKFVQSQKSPRHRSAATRALVSSLLPEAKFRIDDDSTELSRSIIPTPEEIVTSCGFSLEELTENGVFLTRKTAAGFLDAERIPGTIVNHHNLSSEIFVNELGRPISSCTLGHLFTFAELNQFAHKRKRTKLVEIPVPNDIIHFLPRQNELIIVAD